MKNYLYFLLLLCLSAESINLFCFSNKPYTGDGLKDFLPVELIYFKATVDTGGVNLIWGTATEVNNYGFNVERADRSLKWAKIGFVMGSGTSSSTKHYSFKDKNALKDTLYYYRLKQIDNDGSYTYSDSIVINKPVSINENNALRETDFYLLSNYPNPFNPATTIVFILPKAENVTLYLYDASGKLIEKIIDNKFCRQGENKIHYSCRQLASGVYFYKLISGAITRTKKLILSK